MDPYQEDSEYRTQCEELHRQAMAADESFYLDPQTKLRVATAQSLWNRGYCCNYKCRHCPYGDPKRYASLLKMKCE
jgi:hypothetical protein